MNRISSMAANDLLVGTLLRTQTRVYDLQVQVSTGQRAQSYAGLAADSHELLSAETMRAASDRFERDNALLSTRLAAVTQAVDQVDTVVRDFREHLVASSSKPLDATAVSELQAAAFRAMKGLEATLNADFNGRFLFSGSRINSQPVTTGAATLAEFQGLYDGGAVTFPPTRAAAVGTQARLDPAVTGGLDFDAASGAIRAATPGAFTTVQEGATIEISGSPANFGRYTVVAKLSDEEILITGTLAAGSATLTVTNSVADETGVAATLTVSSWYGGDQLVSRHRLDDRHALSLDVTAIDPAFEKAMRGMAIIAQGTAGTPGGLDANPQRIGEALTLLNGALDVSAASGSAYGSEDGAVLDDVSMRLGYASVLLAETGETHRHLKGLMEGRIAELETVEPTEAIARLLDETRALEASYQALARVRELSLTKFL
jgi:flagellin-like hook-associated protein FlgL